MRRTLLRIIGLKNHGLGPIELEIADQECVCLSGPSGAGKTLFLRAVADLDPHDGEVWLGDKEASGFRPDDWRRAVGLLPAESQWWSDRVGDHFKETDTAMLESLGFGPEVMEWQVARCSTGERQRLALLRLLENRPRVLLLDEPTASLDPETVQRVEGLIRDYRHVNRAAVLWVSHDPAQIGRVADRHFRIREGRLGEAPI